jgi:hypothetical protein
MTISHTNRSDALSIDLNGNNIFNKQIDTESLEIGPLQIELKMGTNIIGIHSKNFDSNIHDFHGSQFFLVKNFRVSFIKKNKPVFKDKVELIKMLKQLRHTRLFFTNYYSGQSSNTHLNKRQAELHYILYGAWENMDPNPLFDSSWYFTKYTDVYLTGHNPLIHFSLYGWKEGRDPHPDFSTNYYLGYYDDVRNSGMNPLLHFLKHGIFEGRRIFPSA